MLQKIVFNLLISCLLSLTAIAGEFNGFGSYQEHNKYFQLSSSIELGQISIVSNDDKNLKLGYTYFQGTSSKKLAPILWVVGKGELSLEYSGVVALLRKRGLKNPVYVFDLMGQGFSSRFGKRFDEISHFDSVTSLYKPVKEMARFVIQDQKTGLKPYLIGHSTGGLAVAAAMALPGSSLNSYVQDRVLLVSPFLGLLTKGIGDVDTGTVLGNIQFTVFNIWNKVTFKMKKEASPEHSYQELLAELKEVGSDVTGNLEKLKSIYWLRFNIVEILKSKAVTLRPSFDMKLVEENGAWVMGATNKWIFEVGQAFAIVDQNPNQLADYDITFLLADGESIVSNNKSREMAFRTYLNMDSVKDVENSKHGIHIEGSDQMDKLFNELDQLVN